MDYRNLNDAERKALMLEYAAMYVTLRDISLAASLATDQPGPIGKLLQSIKGQADTALATVAL